MTTTRQPKQTYSQIIVNHMLAGQTISTYQAYDLYNITCLAQRVSDLRAAGVSIHSRTVKQNGKHFSVYWMDKPTTDNKESTNESV